MVDAQMELVKSNEARRQLTTVLERSIAFRPFLEKYQVEGMIELLCPIGTFAPYTPMQLLDDHELEEIGRKKPKDLMFLEDGTYITVTFDFDAFFGIPISFLADYMKREITHEEATELYDALISAGILQKVYCYTGSTLDLGEGEQLIIQYREKVEDPKVNETIYSDPELVFDTRRVAISREVKNIMLSLCDADD